MKLFYALLFFSFLSFAQQPNNDDFTCGQDYYDSRDGRYYSTTLIGDMCWFAENLKFIYDYGFSEYQQWFINLDQGITWGYGSAETSLDSIGAFYHYTVDKNNICPEGSYLPSVADFEKLYEIPGVTSYSLYASGWTGFDLDSSINNRYYNFVDPGQVPEGSLYNDGYGYGIMSINNNRLITSGNNEIYVDLIHDELATNHTSRDAYKARCLIETGCTDSTSLNFTSNAIADDGSCIPIILGCIDSKSYTYDASANTDDGTCEYVFGCTDPVAKNYDVSANSDDGTCSYDPIIFRDTYLIPYKISNPLSWGHYGLETGASNSSSGNLNTKQISEQFESFENDVATPATFCHDLNLFGFTDWYLPSRYEYGTIGSFIDAIYPSETLWSSTESSSTSAYNSYGSTYNKSEELYFTCIRKNIYGCTDSTAINFDLFASHNDGSCQYNSPGCTNQYATNFEENANFDDGSCTFIPIHHNEYFVIPYKISEPMPWGFYGLETNSSSNDGKLNTSELSTLFKSIDDSVITPATYCQDLELFGFSDWYLPSKTEFSQINGYTNNIYGSQYLWTSSESSATNAYSYRNGSSASDSKNYERSFTCIRKNTFGCTDSKAINFSELANINDGTCIEVVTGCLDANAINFNENANQSDETCLYHNGSVVFEENFNDFLTNLPSVESSEWTYQTFFSHPDYTIDGTNFILSDADSDNADKINDFILPIHIDTNGVDSLSLSFDYVHQEYYKTDQVLISSDSINWTSIFVFSQESTWSNFSNVSLDISDFKSDTLYLNFYRDPHSGGADYLAIDNIKLVAFDFKTGCSDSNAVNYNPVSDIDISDCLYQVNADSLLVNNYEQLTDAYNEINDNYELLFNSIDTGLILIQLKEGWNMIGYTRSTEQDVVATLDHISSDVKFVKNNRGDVYWPEFGHNSIGNFVPGQGYQMKLHNDVSDFFFPDVGDLRIELNTDVPNWALDLDIENHPNDIRSIVKVVNMLGQEVNPKKQFKGEVLLYLYNDATVEKKIIK